MKRGFACYGRLLPCLPLICIALLALATGCRTMQPLAPVDLSGPDWIIHQGQAVWKSTADAPEITGELLLATKPDGSSFVQFSKNPLPLIVGQTTTNAWQIQFVPEGKTFSGWGKPPARLLWLHLGGLLLESTTVENVAVTKGANHSTRIENRRSGEAIELYLVREGTSYEIKSGDTFALIARKFGITVQALQDANPDARPDRLRVGQKLQIPEARP